MRVFTHLNGVLHARCREFCIGCNGLFRREDSNNTPVGIVEPCIYLLVVVARIASIGAWIAEHADQVTKTPRRKDCYILITGVALAALVLRENAQQWAWYAVMYITAESLFATLSMLFVSPYWPQTSKAVKAQTREPISAARSIWLAIITYVEVVLAFAFLFIQPGIEVIRTSCGNTVSTPSEAVYFSFVTITTLGYGDYAPSNALAQRLVVTEVGIGVFLVVVIIGHILGLLGRDNARKEA